MEEHKESTVAINQDPKTGAIYAVQQGIVAKEAVAESAIPNCNITCITGTEMRHALAGYLTVLYEQSPESVGGELPGEDFYYVP